MIEDTSNLPGLTCKIVELEEADKETMHLLVFLFMQFLSRQDQAYPTDEKTLSKTQGIVLRHLYLLLGYNQTERTFHLQPQRQRISSVFNVFISNLSQLLDQNHVMGWVMIPPVLAILLYCPCPPQRLPLTDHQPPTYSLWFLEPNIRRSWLMSVLVILYKYEYGQQPWCTQLQSLIKIILNTLDSQHHQCKRIPATVVMAGPPSRSRDVSQPSLGADHELIGVVGEIDADSPPMRTQMVSIHSRSPGVSSQAMETHWEEQAPDYYIKHPSAGSLGELEDSSALASRSASMMMMMTRTSIPGGFLSRSVVPHDIPEHPKAETSRPTWFLGNEDDSQAGGKKWGIQEGVKMMVASSMLSRHESHRVPVTKAASLTEKSHDFDKTKASTALTITTCNFPRIEQSPKEKSPILSIRTEPSESPVAKHLGRQKNVDYTPPLSLTSPLSPNQLAPSDDSSSPAVSSISSSQVTSTDNGHQLWTGPALVTPTVERLLPIGNTGMRSAIARSAHRLIRDDTFGSPESPLSKMDVLTVSSSFEQDSETGASSDVTSPRSMSQLEFPMPERLLPIGGIQGQCISGLVERVRQALGVPEDDQLPLSLATDPDRSPQKQDSTTSECLSSAALIPINDNLPSRCASPRRLIKQVALESPPPVETDDFSFHTFEHERRHKFKDYTRTRDRNRRAYIGSNHHHALGQRRMDSWTPNQSTNMDPAALQACHADFNLRQSSFRIGDECIYDRCSECGTIKEEYSDEELGLCIITLGTFIHREPALAAPMLPEILTIVTKVALNAMYSWQNETNMHLPGGAISVAHQFLRCVLHQLAPNGIFVQMFQTHINENTRKQFFKSVTQALVDFNELNPIAPIQLLLETLNNKKSLPVDNLPTILHNIACYLDCLPLEAGLGPGATTWGGLLAQFESFFRRLILLLPSIEDTTSLLRIMISILKVPGIQQTKSILDPFSKVLSYSIQHCHLKYSYLTDLCHLCNRGYLRERDKHFLGRTIVFELVQAMKFKTNIPDNNFLLLLQFVLQDVGGTLPSTVNIEKSINGEVSSQIFNTNSTETLRNQMTDIIDFLADVHSLSKIKSYNKGLQAGLNEDTLGGTLKCGFAQYLALEITRGNNRENKAVGRYLPWLYSAPSMVPQGAREYVECIGHIRLLSWILLGSLTHTAMNAGNHSHTHGPPIPVAQPIPQEVSCHVADHVQVIFSGFPEQSKASVLHMSSLFHAFILCQLWTIYLEEISRSNAANSESYNVTMNILLEFWGKVTPNILQLVSTSKVLAEMVNLHFLSLLEALLECQSVLLSKLFPLWSQILFSQHVQLPGHLQMRLQNCRNFPPTRMADNYISNRRESNAMLLRWLRRLQFRMGQIEVQSSTVTTQFYSI